MCGQDERRSRGPSLSRVSCRYSARMARPREYPAMLAMIADGRLEPQRLLGEVIDLEQAGEALMAMDRSVPAQAGIVVATI